jgi:hypothetical protein
LAVSPQDSRISQLETLLALTIVRTLSKKKRQLIVNYCVKNLTAQIEPDLLRFHVFCMCLPFISVIRHTAHTLTFNFGEFCSLSSLALPSSLLSLSPSSLPSTTTHSCH